MTTVWSGAELPEKLRGVTVSLSVDFVDTARGEDLTGIGRVVGLLERVGDPGKDRIDGAGADPGAERGSGRVASG